MSLQINRETIKAFILNELSEEMMSLVSDAILTNERLAKIYEEEKFKIDTKLYHDNEMTPTQRLEFESKLIKDMEFFIEVNQNEEKNGSSEELHLRRKLDDTHKTYKASQKQHSTTPRNDSIIGRFKYWLAAVSIVILVIIAGVISYNTPPSDSLENRLFEEYYKPLSAKDIFLLNNGSLNLARQKYLEGDYTNAILLLKDLPSYVTIEVEKNLYIGLALMEIGDYKAATGYLEKIMANQTDFNFIPQVRWYLGLCYLKEGNNEKAIGLFRTIVDKNSFNYRQAKKILRKLSN
ncbi:MAG: tetratricopeptide repeat protein [Bacteroidales bacterium]|nr:tetratricopeptide repeat protein [Bacteroidales bacterium]